MIKHGRTGIMENLHTVTNWSALLREADWRALLGETKRRTLLSGLKSLKIGVSNMTEREQVLVILGALIGIMIVHLAWGLSLLGCALLGWCGA